MISYPCVSLSMDLFDSVCQLFGETIHNRFGETIHNRFGETIHNMFGCLLFCC